MEFLKRSSTAEGTAAMRAMHLLYDQPVIFSDPFALQLTSPSLRLICQNRFLWWLVRRKFISEIFRPIAAQVISRSKYTEEKLEKAVLRGISQYVIIGAGLDSFCLRRPDFAVDLQIFEIDHPDTQQIKKRRLQEIKDYPPSKVEFLAVDLEVQTIAEALSASSFVKEEKAFFSWLGTTPYLTENSVFNTLRDIASFAALESEIVFDYVITPELLDPDEQRIFRKVMRTTERRGEALQSFFDPQVLQDKVSNLGYRILENQSPAEQNRCYFSDRSDGLFTHRVCYNIHAEII